VGRTVRAVLYTGVHAAVRLPERVLEELTHEARWLGARYRSPGCTSLLCGTIRERYCLLSTHPPNNGPEWEQIRQAHSRLRLINSRVEDPEIKRELEIVEEMLITRPRVAMDKPHLSARELDVLACVADGAHQRRSSGRNGNWRRNRQILSAFMYA